LTHILNAYHYAMKVLLLHHLYILNLSLGIIIIDIIRMHNKFDHENWTGNTEIDSTRIAEKPFW